MPIPFFLFSPRCNNVHRNEWTLSQQLDRKKKEGTYKTKKQKEQEARAEAAKAAMLAAGLEGKRADRPPAFVFYRVVLCYVRVCGPGLGSTFFYRAADCCLCR